jgi:hypothetical protein
MSAEVEAVTAATPKELVGMMADTIAMLGMIAEVMADRLSAAK